MDSSNKFSSLLNEFNEELDELLGDPLLSDLPEDVTFEELEALLALEYGQAMNVNVIREDNVVLPIIVSKAATIKEFKKAIQRYMSLKMKREGLKKCISWKYVWKTYWLCFNGEKLKDDKKTLQDYNLFHHCNITFVKSC